METKRRERILIVEDDEEVAKVLKGRLECEGYETHTEETGKAALSYAADYRPDLVVLDVGLPDISGLEVAKWLRKIYLPWVVPILMLTGRDQPVDKLYGFAHGADSYLTKPYDPSELRQTVKLLLRELTGSWGPFVPEKSVD